MNELIIDLALDGFKVSISDGGFAMKDSLQIELSKKSPKETNWVSVKVLAWHDFQFIDSILREMRDEVTNKISTEY